MTKVNLPTSLVSASQQTLTAPGTLVNGIALMDATGSVAPSSLSVVAVSNGGTFAAGNYFWKVTATGGLSSESLPSNESPAVAVAANGSATLTFKLPAGETGFKVYRSLNNSGAEVLVATVTGQTAGTINWTDTGGATGGTVPPTASNGTFSQPLPDATTFSGMLILESVTSQPYVVTLSTVSGQTIDGSSTLQIGSVSSGAPYQAVTLIPVSGNWRTI